MRAQVVAGDNKQFITGEAPIVRFEGSNIVVRFEGDDYYIEDAHELKNERSSDSAGLRCIAEIAARCAPGGGGGGADGAPPACLVLTGATAELAEFLGGDGAPLAALVTTRLACPDFDPPECAEVAKHMATTMGFTIDPTLHIERLATILAPRQRSSSASARNARMVREVLTEAVRRQTDRLHASGTLSAGSLTKLCEEDFTDGAGGDERAAARLHPSSPPRHDSARCCPSNF